MKRSIFLVVVLAAVVSSVDAAVPYQRPAGIADELEPLIVAGYRALFTCSAHFFAGRPLEDIKKVELVDVAGLGYPDPIIDEQHRLVTAADNSGQIVRIAAFRDAKEAQIVLREFVVRYANLKLTARELRGGAIIFLVPQTLSSTTN